MIQINNLTLTHRQDLHTVLHNFSLTLNQGDKAAIIGEEGNGKSTLLKWLFNPALIADYIDCEGTQSTPGETLAYLPQELPHQAGEMTVYEFFLDEDEFLMHTPKELGHIAQEFNLPLTFFYEDTLMKNLSGGEKIKAQLMRIIISKPTALLLDEPSNDLDIETLEWLENFFNNWNGILLFVSHDEDLITNTANKIIHLEQLKRKTECRSTVSKMGYVQYMNQRSTNLVKQKKQALNEKKEQTKRDEKLRRVRQSVEYELRTVSRQEPEVGRLLKKKMHTVKAMERRYQKEKQNNTESPDYEEAIKIRPQSIEQALPSNKKILNLNQLILQTPDGKALSSPITLQVFGPEKIIITGRNGSGKSTLLKAIYNELQSHKDLDVLYMPQNYTEQLDENLTPIEAIMYEGTKDERTKIQTYLGSLKFTPKEMNHPLRSLSGGQKAKVYLLKILLSQANVLLLDEPTRNFSPLSAPELRKLLNEFDGVLICVTHDRKLIQEIDAKILELSSSGLRIK